MSIATRRYPNTDFTRSKKLKAAVDLNTQNVNIVHNVYQIQHPDLFEHSGCDEDGCERCPKKCHEDKSRRCGPCDSLTPICVPSPHAVVYCGDGVITKYDFQKDAVNGIIINKPGCYRLGGNIKFKPTVRATTAITIAASGVILDFDKYSIKLCNKQCDIYGVAVSRCVSRVRITGQKGISKITGFNAAGIRVLGNTQHITVENIIVSQDEPIGLYNKDIPENLDNIIDIRITYGIAVGEGDGAGLVFKGTDPRNWVEDFTLKDVVCEKCVIGCEIIFTRIGLLEDCLFTQNTYYGLLCGPNWFIPSLEDSTVQAFPVVCDIVARRIHGDYNNGPFEELSNPSETFFFDFLSGLAFYEAQNCLVEDSSSNGNVSPTLLIAIDHDGSKNMTWNNAQVNGNESTGFQCLGFNMTGTIPYSTGLPYGLFRPLQKNIGSSVRGVVSDGNKASSFVAGFSFNYGDGVSVQDCVSQKNVANGGSAFGYDVRGTVGITGGDDLNLLFKNCVAQANGDSQSTVAAGFSISSPTRHVVIDDCVASSNGNNINGNNTNNLLVAAGIYVDAPNADVFKGTFGVERLVISNSNIHANGTSDVELSGGIVLYRNTATSDDLPIDHVLIDHNIISHNSGDGVHSEGQVDHLIIKKNELVDNTGFGIEIVDNPSTVVAVKNIAVTNEAGNYAGIPSPAIVEVIYPNLVVPDLGLANISVVLS